MKFGGTSLSTVERIKKAAELITREEKPFVVVSAMAGTTDTLLEAAAYLLSKNYEGAVETLCALEEKYLSVAGQLYSGAKASAKAAEYVGEVFAFLKTYPKQLFTPAREKVLLAQGELLTTQLVFYYLQEKGVKAALVPALDFMALNQQGEPDMEYISSHLQPLAASNADAEVILTQGFICKNAQDEVDNLGRGGSDYTASLAGVALGASEIQIWSDIDGLHDNDPRVVEGTRSVPHLLFDEAAELAYFGADILHPTCIQPAKFANIPVRLLNTMDPDARAPSSTTGRSAAPSRRWRPRTT